MNSYMTKRTLHVSIWAMLLCSALHAQTMTLEEAIFEARGHSVQALAARNEFISAYWAYRSYEASRLPSFVLYGNLMNFNRSLNLLQNYETGEMVYSGTYNLQNSLGLAVNQAVTWTGGTLTLYSDLSRIDQFKNVGSLTWYAQPVTLSYNQPLFAYNRYKWDKLIEPKAYRKSKRVYLETMEDVSINASSAFFDLMLAQLRQETARANYEDSAVMREIARTRLSLGSVTRDEFLQLEMRMLTDSIQINETSVMVREAQMRLNSLLGYDEKAEVQPVFREVLPDLLLDYDRVLELSLENSSFPLQNEINILEARSAVAKAKADRGITMSFNARFGLSNTAPELQGVYRRPLNQEVAGLSFSIPIFDWGLGRGRVQKAQAAESVVEARAQQDENDFRRRVFSEVAQFNSQRGQCQVSARAADISAERYSLVQERFRDGSVTVTELVNARQEKDNAQVQYVTDIGNYWQSYLSLRKLTLYDFLKDRPLDIDTQELLGE